MAKKKERNTYNIDKVELEIDYKKLAEAIVKAQENAAKTKKRPNRMRGAIMGSLNAMLYFLVGLVSIIAIIGAWIEYASTLENPTRYLSDYIGCTVMLVVSALLSVMCGIEAIKDNDEAAQTHFNSLIAVVALIVSLVALYRG